MNSISKQVEDIAWNKHQLTAQAIIDEITKQLKDKYQEQDR